MAPKGSKGMRPGAMKQSPLTAYMKAMQTNPGIIQRQNEATSTMQYPLDLSIVVLILIMAFMLIMILILTIAFDFDCPTF